MRPIERIKPYIRLIKNKSTDPNSDTALILKDIDTDIFDELEKEWLENPDWRLTRLCVNTGLFPNIPGMWYYEEDLDVMLRLGFEPRDVVLWGTYGKNLDKPLKYVSLKDMSNDHIQAVLTNVKSLSDRYRKFFEDELEYRKENNIVIEDTK